MPEYYLQDSRDYVGNAVLWWAKNCAGYTTDVSKAHVFSKGEAESRRKSRETDIPWPKDYIDSITRPVVDVQHIDREAADSAAAPTDGRE